MPGVHPDTTTQPEAPTNPNPKGRATQSDIGGFAQALSEKLGSPVVSLGNGQYIVVNPNYKEQLTAFLSGRSDRVQTATPSGIIITAENVPPKK